MTEIVSRRDAVKRFPPFQSLGISSTSASDTIRRFVERMSVSPVGSGSVSADIRLRTGGLTHLVADLRVVGPKPRRVA